MIGGHLVESGPASPQVEACGGRSRESPLERLDDPLREGRIKRGDEPRRLIGIRVGDEDAAPFLPDQDSGVRVDGHRNHRGKLAARSGHQEMAPHGLDGQLDTGQRGDAGRPRSGRVHDDPGLTLPLRRRHDERARLRPIDREDLGAAGELDPGAGGLSQEERGQRPRIDEPVARAERPADQIGALDERGEPERVVPVEKLDGHAQRLLEGHRPLHRREAGGARGEEQVARLAIDGRLADLGGQGVEDLHRAQRHLDVHFRCELCPDAAVGLGRRPGSGDVLALDDRHAPDAAPREVERDAAADDAGSDDQHFVARDHETILGQRASVLISDGADITRKNPLPCRFTRRSTSLGPATALGLPDEYS